MENIKLEFRHALLWENSVSLKISMIDAPCGAGKSREIKNSVATMNGQHLIAVPTGKLMDEYVSDLAALVAQAGTPDVVVQHFFSTSDGGQTIARRIGEAKAGLTKGQHAVFIITHAALFGSVNHQSFQDWHLWVDEVPGLLISHAHSSSAIGPLMSAYYNLVPVTPKISRIVRRADSDLPPEAKSRLTVADVMEDKFLSGWAEVARHCSSGADVLVNLNSWADIPKRKNWLTLCIFDCQRLSPFASVQIYGNAVAHTVTYQWLDARPEIDVKMRPLSNARSWISRPVTINYFARQHLLTESNKPVWESNLPKVVDWLRQQSWCQFDNHFWMTNRGMGITLPGPQLDPMAHGLNHLQDRDAVTVVFKSKPDRVETRMFGQLGIDRTTLIHQREHEVIAQAVMRGSIRDPQCTQPFFANVYDHDQAERLRAFLTQNYGIPVSLQHIAVDGFIDDLPARKTAGRRRQWTPEQKRCRQLDRMKIQRAKAKLSPEQRGNWRQHLPPDLRLKQLRLEAAQHPSA